MSCAMEEKKGSAFQRTYWGAGRQGIGRAQARRNNDRPAAWAKRTCTWYGMVAVSCGCHGVYVCVQGGRERDMKQAILQHTPQQ